MTGNSPDTPSSRVLLIVPPFHQAFTPAMGVSLLKAELTAIGIACDVSYLNLRFAQRIGPELYTQIAAESRFEALAGEWLFAGDLFGDAAPDTARYLDDVLLGRYGKDYDATSARRLGELRDRVPSFLDEVMGEIDWNRYAIVGVSSTHLANCAGLAVLKRVRAHHPTIRTAMGGANCEGQMGAAIHELFPFVDFVCSGEGDLAVPELFRRVLVGESTGDLTGIFSRESAGLMGANIHTPLVLDLDALPYPDFDDYFAQAAETKVATIETPTMAIETSRGCWWGQKHQCTFCGLNGGTMQFRAKSPDRALSEIDYLVERYPSRHFYATDNILHFEYFETLLNELARRPRPPRLYFETKANLSKDQIRLLKRAGFWGVYLGIENLSTAVLRQMDKGTSGLLNIRALKWCAEIGLTPDWAFLCGFPGEDPAEYERMAELVPSLTHLRPPVGPYQIRIDRYSPYFVAPEAYGLRNVHATLAYRHVYPLEPEQLDRLAYYFDYEYAADQNPDDYTASLSAAVEIWRREGRAATLRLHDDDACLHIADTRPARTQPLVELEGAQRLAYLALDAGVTIAAVRESLVESLGGAAPREADVREWIEEWLAQRLVMREGSRVMSLAVNQAERIELPVDRFLAGLVAKSR